jgi:hypothetical protein
MKYIYYISYSFNTSEGVSGFGSCSVTIATPIASMDDIQEVQRAIESSTGNKVVVIISYILMRTEEDSQ